jgi:hypothetical protein
VELDEIDILSGAMFRDLEQIYDTRKTGFTGQGRSDVLEIDLAQLIHHDVARAEPVAVTDADAWIFPDANTAGDLAKRYGFSEAFGELHVIRPTILLAESVRRRF